MKIKTKLQCKITSYKSRGYRKRRLREINRYSKSKIGEKFNNSKKFQNAEPELAELKCF